MTRDGLSAPMTRNFVVVGWIGQLPRPIAERDQRSALRSKGATMRSLMSMWAQTETIPPASARTLPPNTLA
jgi:hypothetical protein